MAFRLGAESTTTRTVPQVFSTLIVKLAVGRQMTVDSAEEETTSVRLTDVDTEEHLHIVEQEEEGEDMEEEDDEIVDMVSYIVEIMRL